MRASGPTNLTYSHRMMVRIIHTIHGKDAARETAQELKEMNQNDEHLAQACIQVSVMADCRAQLKPEDLRFLEKWESDLRNNKINPDLHPISEWQIRQLRAVFVSIGNEIKQDPNPFDEIDSVRRLIKPEVDAT
jgi:hypothetical protein